MDIQSVNERLRETVESLNVSDSDSASSARADRAELHEVPPPSVPPPRSPLPPPPPPGITSTTLSLTSAIYEYRVPRFALMPATLPQYIGSYTGSCNGRTSMVHVGCCETPSI